ncbi:MAG: regulatory protein RecX [Saccharofermentanales bacterium]|jgi:SOS response regulatory protein OraA/RecX|nr:regulatory protein RecX [Bacillota bacterium]NLB08731.1 RecX family transcriptional regulator [Clostridiales bacterium]
MPELSFDDLREKAVRFIGLRQNKSSGQVRLRLERENANGQLIEAVIDYLRDIDYIDDFRAGRAMMRNYQGRRLRSRLAVQYELKQKGVPGKIAAELAEELPTDYDSACELVQVCFPNPSVIDRQQINNLLRSRGYDYSLAREIIDKYFAEK